MHSGDALLLLSVPGVLSPLFRVCFLLQGYILLQGKLALTTEAVARSPAPNSKWQQGWRS